MAFNKFCAAALGVGGARLGNVSIGSLAELLSPPNSPASPRASHV